MAGKRRKKIKKVNRNALKRSPYGGPDWHSMKQKFSFGAATGPIPNPKSPTDAWIEVQGTLRRLQQASFRQWVQTFYCIKYNDRRYIDLRLCFSGRQFFWVRQVDETSKMEHSEEFESKQLALIYFGCNKLTWEGFEEEASAVGVYPMALGIPCTKPLPSKFKKEMEKDDNDGLSQMSEVSSDQTDSTLDL